MADLTGPSATGPVDATPGHPRHRREERDPAADPRTMRVEVRSAMGLEAGPWTLGPDDPRHGRIMWLADDRAATDGIGGGGDGDRTPILLGAAGPTGRSGAQRREVVVGGWRVLLDLEPERTASLRERARRGRDDAAHAGPLEVRAIIPGRVVAVSVAQGDTVEAGQQLLVIEAMKMQNELRSPRAGTVERVGAAVGQAVDLGAVLLVLR